jgi:hypothetical protein
MLWLKSDPSYTYMVSKQLLVYVEDRNFLRLHLGLTSYCGCAFLIGLIILFLSRFQLGHRSLTPQNLEIAPDPVPVRGDDESDGRI